MEYEPPHVPWAAEDERNAILDMMRGWDESVILLAQCIRRGLHYALNDVDDTHK